MYKGLEARERDRIFKLPDPPKKEEMSRLCGREERVCEELDFQSPREDDLQSVDWVLFGGR